MQQHGSEYFARRHTLYPRGGVERSKHFLSKSQIKENGALSTTQAPILCLHTPQPLGWGQMVKTFFILTVVMLHIKLKGTEHIAQC